MSDAHWKTDTIATAYLIAGAIVAREYFDNENSPIEKNIRRRVKELIRNVQWKKALIETKKAYLLGKEVDPAGIAHSPMEGYGEGMLAYLLAHASQSDRIPASAWQEWQKTYTMGSYAGYDVLSYPYLPAHHSPHLWLEIKSRQDSFGNYFKNAVNISFINREYSLKENDYPSEVWGLMPCYGPNGFSSYGAPPPKSSQYNDGTISPASACMSLQFVPACAKAALISFEKQYGKKIRGAYGFYESFNPKEEFFEENYTAINIGRILLGINAYHSGKVKDLFTGSAGIKDALRRLGFGRNKRQNT